MLLLMIATATSSALPARCGGRAQAIAAAPHRPAIHPLSEEPNATAIAAVDRRVDHCPAPIVLRRDIGGSARRVPVR